MSSDRIESPNRGTRKSPRSSTRKASTAAQARLLLQKMKNAFTRRTLVDMPRNLESVFQKHVNGLHAFEKDWPDKAQADEFEDHVNSLVDPQNVDGLMDIGSSLLAYTRKTLKVVIPLLVGFNLYNPKKLLKRARVKASEGQSYVFLYGQQPREIALSSMMFFLEILIRLQKRVVKLVSELEHAPDEEVVSGFRAEVARKFWNRSEQDRVVHEAYVIFQISERLLSPPYLISYTGQVHLWKIMLTRLQRKRLVEDGAIPEDIATDLDAQMAEKEGNQDGGEGEEDSDEESLGEEREIWADATWKLPGHDGMHFIRYKCPFCEEKSVYINWDLYDGNLQDCTKPLCNAVRIGEDNKFYHRDNYPIPSTRRGRKQKKVGEKRIDMRQHHRFMHPDEGMPMAYREQEVARALPKDDPEERRKEKNAREKRLREERAARVKNGTATQEDLDYYEARKRASKRQREEAKKKAAEARVRV
jgi:hypothetical protein